MTELLPGQLLYIFGASIFNAALLSWLALLWYRRSVSRLMRQAPADAVASSIVPHDSPVSSRSSAPPTEHGELTLAEEPLVAPRYHALVYRPEMARVIVAYTVGAAAFAATITGFKYWTVSPPLPAVAWLIDWWINLWPLVPTLVALLVLDRAIALRLVVFYLLGGALAIFLFTAAGQLLRGMLNTAPLTNIFSGLVSLVWIVSVPFVVIVLTGWRRVRAVMPLALAATLLFGFGAVLFRDMFVRALNVESFRTAFLSAAGLSSPQTLHYALFMLVSLPVGWLAWQLLTVLAAAFANKRFSDTQLVVDCWWAIVAAELTATSLTPTLGFLGIVGGVAAFLAYRLAVAALLRDDRPPQRAARLLLLRVFGYQARTESLFDRVAQTWRLQGPVQLIAGVDLAMRTADPGDMLAFLNGRLADAYVRTQQEVGERLERLDLGPDPDGRFRINEVYCHDNTWRTTLEALLDRTDMVLMDLRSFSAHNAGCRFELEQIVRRVRTDNIVFVCDKTTDLPLLHQILADAWAAEGRERDERGSGQISVVRMERQSRSEFAQLMQRLQRGAQLATAPQVNA
jgi:hypothetical protein